MTPELAIPLAALLFSATSIVVVIILSRTKASNGKVTALDARLDLLETELGIRTGERDEARDERDSVTVERDACERERLRLLTQLSR